MVENKWLLVPCYGNYLTQVDKGAGRAQVALLNPLLTWPIRDVCASLSEKTPSLHSVLSELDWPPAEWRSVSTLYPTMSVTACQGLGFVVSLLGVAGTIAATCMDQWSTQDLYNNPVTAVFNYQGLWRSCVRESSGFTECRGYFTLLGLPGKGWYLAGCGGRRRWTRDSGLCLAHHRRATGEGEAKASTTKVGTGVQET